MPSDEWEITNKAPGADKVLLIRERTADRKRLAAIKIYQDQSSRDFGRELSTLKDLKGKKNTESNGLDAICVNCRREGCRSVDRARQCLKQPRSAHSGST